jgi:gamma-glutamylcyclotransferase (GGCT)/AIG2-like uncharacterized protein YtfP
MKIFVYGTLKKGYNDNFQQGAKVVKHGMTVNKTLLMDCGHPFCIPEEYTKGYYFKDTYLGYTKGEIIIFPQEVPEVISYLDSYEGAPHYFRREKIRVMDDDMTVYNCITYIPSDHTIGTLLGDDYDRRGVEFILPERETLTLEWSR